MPVWLDLSAAVLAPEFQDTFSVVRRAYSVDQNGRSVLTPHAPVAATGVVTPAGPTDLKRLPDDQYQQEAITIVTTYRLQGAVEGGAPDRVQWNGNLYQVIDVEDYSRYGRGFIRAICGIVTSQPNAS